VFLSFFCGVQIGPIFDAKGPKLLILVGSILLCASMLLLGFCTRKLLIPLAPFDSNTQTHTPLTLHCRILSIRARIWSPRRTWHVFHLHPRRLRNRALFPCETRQRNWACRNWWFSWWCHLSIDAAAPIPASWICLVNTYPRIYLCLLMRCCTIPHSFTAASEAWSVGDARFSYFPRQELCILHRRRVLHGVGLIHPCHLFDILRDGDWCDRRHLLLPTRRDHERRFMHRKMGSRLYRRQAWKI